MEVAGPLGTPLGLASEATLWVKAQHEGARHPRASSEKTRGFHTKLDEGPETP